MGFCAFKLVETNGGLIPGNPNIGIVLHKNRYYTFTTTEALKAWCTSPDGYILQALQLARKKVELVSFLQLYDDLFRVQKIDQ